MIGIYCIQNLVNGKRYIGQSINVEARTSDIHRNSHLNNSIKKYGIENFIVTILEECTIDSLDERERYWISYYQTTDPTRGYNKDSGGNLNKILTEETRSKLSVSHLGNTSKRGTRVKNPETVRLLGNYLREYQKTEVYKDARSSQMKESWRDPEFRDKMISSMRVPPTEEHNARVSSSMRGNQNCLGKRNVYKIENGIKLQKKIDGCLFDKYISEGWLSGMGPRIATSLPRT